MYKNRHDRGTYRQLKSSGLDSFFAVFFGTQFTCSRYAAWKRVRRIKHARVFNDVIATHICTCSSHTERRVVTRWSRLAYAKAPSSTHTSRRRENVAVGGVSATLLCFFLAHAELCSSDDISVRRIDTRNRTRAESAISTTRACAYGDTIVSSEAFGNSHERSSDTSVGRAYVVVLVVPVEFSRRVKFFTVTIVYGRVARLGATKINVFVTASRRPDNVFLTARVPFPVWRASPGFYFFF